MVRDTRPEDMADVLRVRTAGWRAAYRGIVPPAYLGAMDDGPEALTRALRHFRERPADRHHLVAERGGRVVAFAVCGAARATLPLPAEGVRPGELHALYAHPEVWSTGVGSLLLEEARRRLAADGYPSTVLWVLEDNMRARAFYERHGLRPTGSRTLLRLGGARLPELQYGAPVLPAPREAGQAVPASRPGGAGVRRAGGPGAARIAC
ncbi:GNAT family N-acetyltransferase [Streptacidiphilus sp. ASG 303]|uniref:GNAT family N-acetyltransferase n=1 Tax=Streptacidiphilus sp. ASG 303 TaxID=2896847 RepID=UPI001E5C0301|nr:GNAT family N-acetyltransferase [Streptacidiphilus sp. ASG 303]MCD0486196.1 GNAT family N-acetyltransferase [Streptacidiphilus sp. ASG 303]